MMQKTLFSLLLIGSAAFAASELKTNQALINGKIDTIESKRGIQVSGNIRAVYLGSYYDSDQKNVDSSSTMPDVERDEFVSADLDFHFHPWDFVRANVMLRLEAGMQDYFSAASKTIGVGWMNLEGNIGSDFYWVVGDFRQRYSPLTLNAPDVQVMYEPQIFSRERQMARTDAQLTGEERNLEGANLQFRRFLGEQAGEIRAEAIGARLRRVQVLDLSGANGNILPNDSVSGASQSANMDKWLLSGNIEWLPMNKNLLLGVTEMFIFDDKSSYSYTYRHEDQTVDGLDSKYVLQSINAVDSLPQRTFVTSVRVGGDVASFLNNPNLILDLTAEYARSSDDVYHSVAISDTTYFAEKEVLDGDAILATLNAGYKSGNTWKVQFSGNYIMNDSNWFNNLAQSPQFFAQRILNTDRDGTVSKYGVNAPLYSTFGALYHFTPKFSPAATTLATDDAGFANGQTSSYDIAPYSKNSWTSLVYTRSELALINSMSDPALQLSLPNGLATSNRTGVQTGITVGLNDFAEVQLLFNSFQQVKAESVFDKAKYLEYGAGAKWDVLKMLRFKLPLEISGSYKHSSRKMGMEGADSLGSGELKCDFFNAGFYWQYLPRLGVSAGWQYIDMTLDDLASLTKGGAGYEVPLVKGKQMQWMVGLDYSLTSDAWFTLNYGIISVENTYNVSSGTGANLNYAILDANEISYKHSFTQTIVEATINVGF
jgi:hypothetical protein